MREWLLKWRYKYVGTAHAETYITDSGIRTGEERHTYWTLTENGFGARRYVRSGDKYNGSAYAKKVKAQVHAWQAGGPLPDHLEFVNQTPKGGAKLIAFTGGRAR